MLVKFWVRAALVPLIIFMLKVTLVAAETDVRTKVPHINAYEALELFNTGRLILLDVNPGQGKVRSDIVGALFVPANKIDRVRLKIPDGMIVGVFCD